MAGLLQAWGLIGTGFVFILIGILLSRLKFNTDLFCYSKRMVNQMLINDKDKNE